MTGVSPLPRCLPAQGGKSVEVRPVGITKGITMQRILHTMTDLLGQEATSFDFVLCIGKFTASRGGGGRWRPGASVSLCWSAG